MHRSSQTSPRRSVVACSSRSEHINLPLPAKATGSGTVADGFGRSYSPDTERPCPVAPPLQYMGARSPWAAAFRGLPAAWEGAYSPVEM